MFTRAVPTSPSSERRWRKRLAPAGAILALVASSLVLLPSLAGATLSGGSPFDASNGIKDANVDQFPDLPTGTSDNSYAQGAKEDDLCPAVETGSIPNNKADLTNFYVATGKGTTDTFLYLAWDRASTNGTVTLDFELNKSGVIKTVPQGCNGVNPDRSVGDKLITYDLQGNKDAQTVVISVRSWGGSAWGPESVLSSAAAEGSISGNLLFGEMAIDLEAAGIFPRGVCNTFTDVMVKSRSSNAFTAEMKDFIAPVYKPVSNCGLVTLHKQDDAGNPVAGVTFTLWKDGKAAGSCSTNSSGDCTIVDVWPGDYTVTETGVPDGYTPISSPIPVHVEILENTPPNPLVVTDPRKPAKVNILKTDDALPPAPLQGAVFGLYLDNSGVIGDAVAGKTCTTGSDGKCSITNILPAGTYWVHEQVVPAGHTAAADQKVTLGLGGTVSLTFADPRLPARIDILKTDDATPAAALAGATFQLYTDEALLHPVAGKSCETGSDGRCSITGILPPGSYVVHEQVVPAGYDGAADQKVTVGLNQTVSLTFVDARQPAGIDIVKTDDAGAPLAGAVFGLYTDADGAPGSAVADKTCTTGTAGTCSITGVLPVGTYWVVETSTPDGYAPADPQPVNLELGQTVTLSFENSRQPASVNIVKRDDTGAALAGATFGLYQDADGQRGTAVDGKSCTTDDAGLCTIDGILPPGTYWLHETTVPAGYEAAPDQHVTLGLNETVTLPDFVDKRIPATVNIVKKDDAGAALAGAGFGLYADNAGAIGSAVPGATCSTNTAGQCSIGGILPAGTYWLHEIVVPVGYAAAADQKVTLGLAQTVTLTFVDRKLVPAIAVVKAGPSAVHVGDAVVYTFTVTNPGETGLTPVVVSDPKCDGTPARSTDDADGILSPGETWVYHCTHVATIADGQSILNTVTVTGTGPLGDNVSAESSHTTTVLHPAISIKKTADPASISVSGSVTYTFVITNTGDAVLHNVLVTDDILGAIGSVGSLDPGESVTMAKTVDVDASTPPTNIGTVVGTDILGETVTANDTATISVVLAEVVTRPAELPRTGGPVSPETRAALALIEIGLILGLSARRSRRTRRQTD